MSSKKKRRRQDKNAMRNKKQGIICACHYCYRSAKNRKRAGALSPIGKRFYP